MVAVPNVVFWLDSCPDVKILDFRARTPPHRHVCLLHETLVFRPSVQKSQRSPRRPFVLKVFITRKLYASKREIFFNSSGNFLTASLCIYRHVAGFRSVNASGGADCNSERYVHHLLVTVDIYVSHVGGSTSVSEPKIAVHHLWSLKLWTRKCQVTSWQ